jgi:hypothetical protein
MNRYFTMGDAAPAAPATPQYTEEPFKLVINQSLAQNAAFADQRAAIDGDGDFIVTDVFGSSTGAYSIKWRNNGMRDMSSAEVNNVNAIGTAQFPVPFGGVKYQSLGQISYSITNLYAGTNAIQIVLSGIRLRPASR